MTVTAETTTSVALKDQPIAHLSSLWKIYAKPGSGVAVEALRGVDLVVQPGEYMAITGPSGSGKSTLMNILGCLDRPSKGLYLLGGQDVSQLDDNALSEIRGRRLGFVFQSFNLITQLSVLENVEVPLFYLGLHRHERHRRAMQMIDMVELTDRSHHRPHELSGGQQQRVAIARALANEPLMILADEPTGNLDTKTGHMILNIFDDLNAQGRTIILVTHEREVAQHCKRTIALRDGLIVSDAPQPD